MDNERKIIEEKIKFIFDLLKEKREKPIESRKEKNKRKIIEFIKQKGSVTLEDVANYLNISINRASEYLKELFNEQKVTFYKKGRKKYFKILNG